MKVAIQGQVGSFHARVARQWFGDACELVECMQFADVFDAYLSGDADAIVTAVENTVYGSINEVYRLIAQSNIPIVGEVKLPITQHLMTKEHVDLHAITEIYSHPVALAQCRATLAALCPNAITIEYPDTAAAAEYVAEVNSSTIAAVASREAAELHRLSIVAPDVHDIDTNITRFLVLQDKTPREPTNRASLLITTSHQPGALVEVLSIFARANINLVKLQSQPIIGSPWRYSFFVVADGTPEQISRCITRISSSDHTVKILGQYKAA